MVWAPRKKEDIINDIALRHSLQTSHCLLVVDPMIDFSAAHITGTPSLAIVQKVAFLPFPEGTETKNSV
jgi:hypothetical protein